MSVLADGRRGERRTRLFIKGMGATDISQPDWIGKWNGEWCVFESKEQDVFEAPPYAGHGLPPYQVAARLQLQAELGLRAVFVVHEKSLPVTWWQYLDVLEEGPHFDTPGPKVRRIYALSSFEVAARPEDLEDEERP